MTRKPPLTQRDLEAVTCEMPGCDHTGHDGGLILSGRCHPGAPIRALYRDGVLVVSCAVCQGFIVNIAVAAGAGWH